jgi:hypothetical protein
MSPQLHKLLRDPSVQSRRSITFVDNTDDLQRSATAKEELDSDLDLDVGVAADVEDSPAVSPLRSLRVVPAMRLQSALKRKQEQRIIPSNDNGSTGSRGGLERADSKNSGSTRNIIEAGGNGSCSSFRGSAGVTRGSVSSRPGSAAPAPSITTARSLVRPSTARAAAEDAARRLQHKEKRLLQYAVETVHASQEAVAEILSLSMPLSNKDGTPNPRHYYNWTYILSETRDAYAEAVDLVLESFAHNHTYIRALNDFPDEIGRRAIEIATRKCQQTLSRRLYFFGRYELLERPNLHESPDCIIMLATDYEKLDIVGGGATDKRQEASVTVALKFMRKKMSFYRSIAAYTNTQLSHDYCIRLLRYHDGDEDPTFASEVRRKGIGSSFLFCIVYLAGENDLQASMSHDKYTVNQRRRSSSAGLYHRDWRAISKVAREIIEAVAHIHDKGIAHGNITRKISFSFAYAASIFAAKLHTLCCNVYMINKLHYFYYAVSPPSLTSITLSINLLHYFNFP